MKKTNYKYLVWLFFLMSCDFGNTNIDPTRPTDAELKEILPAALAQTTQNLASIGGRVTGIVVQHFKGIDAQPESYSQYLIDERTLDEFWKTGLYAGAMKNCALLIGKSEELNQPHYKGIAQILMSINLGIATSFWGEVPYQAAFQGIENTQPTYDSQIIIYQNIQNLLQQSIDNLEKTPTENPPLEDDLIFGGNASKWIATAKALQARYYLHLTKRDNNAASKAQTALQSGAFQSADNQPVFFFNDNINEANPLPLYSFERPEQLAMSDYLYQLLDSLQDPRLAQLAVNINQVPLIYHQDSALYWGQFDAPLALISLTELKFIEAETQLRLGEIANAEMSFQAAVQANFNQLNLPVSIGQTYINQHIHFNNCPTFEDKLAWLIQQKHIALFAQNPIEAWVDYRRTGCPELAVPPNANPSFNPNLIIPRRYLYPISERTTNENNLNEAILRQGGHLLDVDFWAFE